jgi:multicomponent K+:H+ antiporter subunit E
MLTRLFPHPLLTLTLALVWLGLVNKVTPGNVLLGVLFGIVVPLLTAAYWPDRPTIKRPLKVIEYGLVVLWDIIVANVQVAMIILFRRNRDIRSAWLSLPLELTSPEAITVLAGTITMTPRTVSATLSADGSSLLIHCLSTDDTDEVRDAIKTRYERRLKEIFQ